MKFYNVTRKGKDLGRFPKAAFDEMIKNKLLPLDALYWTEGMADWATIASISGATPPIPTPPKAPTATPAKEAKPRKAEADDEPDESNQGSFGSQLFRFFVGVGAVALVVLMIFGKWARGHRKKPDELIKDAFSQTPTVKPKQAAPSLQESAPLATQQAVQFSPYSYFGKEIFASVELAFVNMDTGEEESPFPDEVKLAEGFGHGSIGVVLSDVKKGERYIVEVSGDRFLKPSRMTLTIEKSAKAITVTPKEVFDFEDLAKLRQAVPVNIYFTVQKGNQAPMSTTETFRVRPPNDCPIRMSTYEIDQSGKVFNDVFDSSYVLAGFVNETHPWIDQILKSAKRYSKSGTFTGYQAGNTAVREQVTAIWKALQSHHITYSSITATSGSREHLIQHVRFLEETISNEQANCIDGTVALCSILQKIGLHTGIVLVPGHAYLVVYDKDNEQPLFGVESTMLAGSTIEEAVQATRTGPYALDKVTKAIEDGKDDFTMVNISDARRHLIHPIPYTR